jgi:hypothetical protein
VEIAWRILRFLVSKNGFVVRRVRQAACGQARSSTLPLWPALWRTEEPASKDAKKDRGDEPTDKEAAAGATRRRGRECVERCVQGRWGQGAG